MAKVYVFMANGFEDVEALIPIDVLRRGGVDVITVSTTEDIIVESAHGVGIRADMMFTACDFSDADLLMLPGGMPGASNTETAGCCGQEDRRHLCLTGRRTGPTGSPRW